MITNECLQGLLFGAQNYHCSLSDMLLSARNRLMITNECLQGLLFEAQNYHCSSLSIRPSEGGGGKGNRA